MVIVSSVLILDMSDISTIIMVKSGHVVCVVCKGWQGVCDGEHLIWLRLNTTHIIMYVQGQIQLF